MAAARWAFQSDRPAIEVALRLPGGQDRACGLIADTGAGSRQSVFELILEEQTCIACGGILMGHVQLGGAYSGSFAVYLLNVQIAQLSFDQPVPAVGVPQAPQGFDGIAGLKFLRRFHYGNFGAPDQFGLDRLRHP